MIIQTGMRTDIPAFYRRAGVWISSAWSCDGPQLQKGLLTLAERKSRKSAR